MKLGEVLQVFKALADLSAKDIPVRFGFGIGTRIGILKPHVENHDNQVTKLRHRYGLDQPEAVTSGMTVGTALPQLREIDQEGFQNEYSQLLDQEIEVEILSLPLADLEALKGTDGKAIQGLGSIVARLQPIVTE